MFHPYSFYLQKHKNAKSNESLPSHFSASPYYFTSLSIPPMSKPPFIMSHFAIWGIPFCHLGYPILPFGVSHFAFWDVPFAFWDVPFCLLGCPILPFGMSHFAIWGIFSVHLSTTHRPIPDLPSSFFAAKVLNWGSHSESSLVFVASLFLFFSADRC